MNQGPSGQVIKFMTQYQNYNKKRKYRPNFSRYTRSPTMRSSRHGRSSSRKSLTGNRMHFSHSYTESISPNPVPSRRDRSRSRDQIRFSHSYTKSISPNPAPSSRRGRSRSRNQIRSSHSYTKSISPNPVPSSRRGRSRSRKSLTGNQMRSSHSYTRSRRGRSRSRKSFTGNRMRFSRSRTQSPSRSNFTRSRSSSLSSFHSCSTTYTNGDNKNSRDRERLNYRRIQVENASHEKARARDRRSTIRKEIRVITKGLDAEEYFDPSKSWRENEDIIYGSLIAELVELLPPIDGRAVTRVEIEEILKTAHKNQRSKRRRLEALADLYQTNSLPSEYDIDILKKILQVPHYHSPEHSPERSSSTQLESDDIVVYDLGWRSEELKNLLKILDKRGFELRKSSHKRKRIISDEQKDDTAPKNVPQWCIR
ncbi:hypothetical protein RhiirA4_467735 [Rhizophagus irregularis]|uniref:Uncharacterized protein n=1 Tax=Rhizophagus irregularis TaxID=588596 RepID=A0A2I1GWG6_9GLOM|nr:hypothetical protein RhiirA4_467735 [Rhizophagus irregularis]